MTAARPKTREVIPRDVAPNFKDHGRTVDAHLLRVIGNLQKRWGEAFASEAGLRFALYQDTGHMPGVDTIPCALERLERQGVLEQRWLKPGGILPDGSVCTYGTRLVALPQGRRARRALGVRAAKNRREGVTNRYGARLSMHLAQAKETLCRPAPPDTETDARQRAANEKRERDLARLAELAAQWDTEDKGKPPPE